MLAATVLALCAISLALPVATALEVARQDSDGYGTVWFVDPGEWYVAPAAPAAQASRIRPADDGYGTTWFVDPGEWYVAPESPIFLVGRSVPVSQDEASGAWYVDPGEWYVAPGGPLAQGNQGDSGTD
jgi:hypothetical protein